MSIIDKVGQVRVPNSGKTLIEEKRIVEIHSDENGFLVKYNSDNLKREEKRQIEDVIYEIALSKFELKQIKILSYSNSTEKKQNPASSQGTKKASLQVGHGPMGAEKKRVKSVGKILAIASGKGGVGKSTFSTNLALSLKNEGKRVGLLDADIYGPSIPMMLGCRDQKPGGNDQKKIVPVEAHGIKLISFGFFIGEQDPVIWRGPMLGGVLNQFLFDVEWGELDYLIIDLPPGTGDMQLSLAQLAEIDGVLIISTPQDVALLDAKKGLAMFRQVNVPILGMVENMAYFAPDDMPEKKYYIFGEGGVESAAKEIGVPFLGQVPMEIALREGSDKGFPYMANDNYKERPVWKAFSSIAKSLSFEAKSKDNKGKGFIGRIFK